MFRTIQLSLLVAAVGFATSNLVQGASISMTSEPVDGVLAEVVGQATVSMPLGSRHFVNQTGPLIVGGYSSDPVFNGNAIMFFELPENVQQVTSASLSVMVDLVQATAVRNADLWGLGFQSDTSVNTSWFNAADTDAGAGVGIASRVKVGDNFITGASANGLHTVSGIALTNYLQSLYDAGAVGGDYAIFRANTDYTNVSSPLSRFRFLSGDNGGPSSFPTLNMEFTEIPPIPEPGAGCLLLGTLAAGYVVRRRRNRCAG